MSASSDLPSVLIVDDDLSILDLVGVFLRDIAEVRVAANGREAQEALEASRVDLVLLDLEMPEVSGRQFLAGARGRFPDVRFIVMTAEREVSSVVDLMRRGANDYLVKPLDKEELIRTVNQEWQVLKSIQADGSTGERGDIGTSRNPGFRRVVQLIERAGETSLPVLLEGETGVGKERLAQHVHASSSRAEEPFVVVDCAAIAESLFEAEVFGVEKGAYTGAEESRAGLFVEASGGTLFLDELGELPLRHQGSLLRALQEKKIRPVGGTGERDIDVRVVAATNRNLKEEVEKGRFRLDLFHRLAVFHLKVPALRERPEDIPDLARTICDEVARARGRRLELSDEAIKALANRSYPGNVRELRNLIESAAAVASGEVLYPGDLDALSFANAADVQAELPSLHSPASLDEVQWAAIQQALRAAGGNVSEAARVLGVARTTVYRWISRERARRARDKS